MILKLWFIQFFQGIQWSFHDRTRLHQANVVVSDARELLLTLEKSLAI